MPKTTLGGHSNAWLENEPDYVPPVVEKVAEPKTSAPSSVLEAEVGSQAAIRRWAKDNGMSVSDRGSIKQDIVDAYWAVVGRTKLAKEQ